MIKKIFRYIQSHFLLRNIILAICFIIVFSFVVSIMLNILTRHGQKRVVPSFVGMTIDEAERVADGIGVKLIVADSMYVAKTQPGKILDQIPQEKAEVKSGRKIFLTINSYQPKMELIPYVSGMSLREAKNKLESQGFEIEKLVYKTDIATNSVLSQSFEGEKITRDSKIKATLGSGVVLYVGRNEGSGMPIAPRATGLTLREAKSRIWEIGFNIGEIKYDSEIGIEDMDKARVYMQVPASGTRGSYGSKIDIHLTNDRKKLIDASNISDVQAEEEPADTVDMDELRLQELTF